MPKGKHIDESRKVNAQVNLLSFCFDSFPKTSPTGSHLRKLFSLVVVIESFDYYLPFNLINKSEFLRTLITSNVEIKE